MEKSEIQESEEVANRRAKSRKSLFIAYLCWLFGGFFGLHHLYLRRDIHAFITFSTFGGYFSLGLWRDLWRMPEYVREANNDLEYVKWLRRQVEAHQRPPSSLVRQFGLMIMGNLFAYLVEYAIPKEYLHEYIVFALKFFLVPPASAFGVWLAGNVGRHQGSIVKPMLAAYVGALPSVIFNTSHGSFSTLAATVVFNRYSKEWRIQPRRHKAVSKRLFIFLICIVIYLSLWYSWFYFGCTIEDPETSEPIKCRVAWDNFVNSPGFTNFSEAVLFLVEHIRNQGFMGLWKEVMQEFDVSGKSTALAVLGLSDNATPQEILSQYKKLSREYHPDRERDESKKAENHEKFIQVQEAFRKLESHVQRYKLQKEREDDESSRDEL